MLSKMKELREERESGFTLIELLVVILIIGILSAIAIPAFLNQRKSAVDSSVKSDVVNVAKEIETWMIKNPSANVPSGALTMSGGTLVGIPASIKTTFPNIKLSDGTSVTITGGTGVTATTPRGTFTILGTNEGGDKAVSDDGNAATVDGIRYDSFAGGMQK